jgi:hypothetical protein
MSLADLASPWWLLALPIGFLALLFAAAVLEKRHARPYVSLDARPAPRPGGRTPNDRADLPDPSQISDYVAVMSRDAEAAGLRFGGMLAHASAPRIRILGSIWMSPPRDLLVLTGSGTVMKMPAYQTWLMTPLADGRVLVTTDNNDEGDLSGLYVTRRVLNAPFPELLATHRAQMQKHGAAVATFAEPTALDALMRVYDRRVERLVGRGLANHVYADRAQWRYTALGGLAVCGNFFAQFAGAIRQAGRAGGQPIASTQLRPAPTAGGTR